MEFLVKDISKAFHLERLNEAIRSVSYPKAKKQHGRKWETTLALLPVSHRDRHWVTGLFKEEPKFRVVIYQRLNTTEEEHSFDLCHGTHRLTVEESFRQLNATLEPLVEDGEVQLTSKLLHAAILPKPKTAQQLALDLVEVVHKAGLSGEEYWIAVNQALESRRIREEEHDGETNHLHRAASRNQHGIIWREMERRLSKREIGVPPSELLEESDQAGYPPLLLAASNGYIEACFALLAAGCNPNATHTKTGDTALHCAIEHPLVVKALCCCGADSSIANFKGETPLDKAKMSQSKNAKKSASIFEEVVDLQKKCDAYYDSVKFLPGPTGMEDKTYLLSLDGGGMRGIIIINILEHIENRMKQLQPNCPTIASCFNYIAGTSAGGLTALLLGHRGVSLNTTRFFLLRTLTDVFMKPRAERGRRIKELIMEYLGDDVKMANHTDTRVIVTSTLYEHSPPKLHLMCNYGPPRDGQPGPEERLTWEAACASTAAPYYFPSFQGKFLDGGLMANNPTLAAMTEIFNQAERESKPVELGLVVSIGTGIPPPEPVKDIEFFLSNPLKLLHKSTISGITSVLQLFVSQVTESNGQQVEIASAMCRQLNTTYLRFSPSLPHDYSLDTNDPDEVLDIVYANYKYLLQQHEAIDQCAKLLLAKMQQKNRH